MSTAGASAQFWGTAYEGSGDLDVALAAIEDATRTVGMVCQRRMPADGVVEIDAVQQAPWHQVLLKCLPQRAAWRLSLAGGRLRVYADFQKLRWYRVLVTVLWLGIGLGLVGAVRSAAQESGFSWISVGMTSYVAFVLVLFAVLTYISLGGGHHADGIWHTVLARVETAGGCLEPSGSLVSRRNVVNYVVLLGFVFALAVWVVWDSLEDAASTPPNLLSGMLVVIGALVLVLILTAVLMYRRGEINLRSIPILTGFSTALSVFFYLSPILLWLGLASYPDIPRRLREGQLLMTGKLVTAGGDVVSVQQLPPATLELYRSFRFFCWQIFAALAFLTGIAVVIFSFLSVYYSTYVARILARIQVNRARGIYRQAVEGSAVLTPFRVAFVTSWIFVSGGALVGLGFLSLCAFEAVVPSFSTPYLRLAEFSSALASFALGQPVAGGWLDATVRAGWVFYACSALSLYALSVGQLWHENGTTRRRLRSIARRPSHSRQSDLQRQVEDMRSPAGYVSVAVIDGLSFDVSSSAFGLFRQDRFITISALCLDYLSDEDIKALLSHELAHHLEGHCRLDQSLRWLGRLTFVGDGFVLGLQNSWGYEHGADKAAVENLGTPRKALREALQRLRAVRALWQAQRKGQRGLGAHGDERKVIPEFLSDLSSPISGGQRWRQAWFCFYHQYFHAMRLHYWYPPAAERVPLQRASRDE